MVIKLLEYRHKKHSGGHGREGRLSGSRSRHRRRERPDQGERWRVYVRHGGSWVIVDVPAVSWTRPTVVGRYSALEDSPIGEDVDDLRHLAPATSRNDRKLWMRAVGAS